MNNETWKPMYGFESIYHISDLGRVKSLIGNFAGKITTGYTNKKGYVRLSLISAPKGKRVNKALHRMVAYTFIPKPAGKDFVNHKNGIKTDNRVDNLEWCTSSENELHSYRVLGKNPVKTSLGKFGSLNAKSKAVLVFKDGELVDEVIGVNETARRFDLEPSAIAMVAAGKRKFHKGYTFKYSSRYE